MSHYRAGMDQDWAEARDWFTASNPSALKQLADAAAEDSPSRLIEQMTKQPLVADVVQRLVLLALHEISTQQLEKQAEP